MVDEDKIVSGFVQPEPPPQSNGGAKVLPILLFMLDNELRDDCPSTRVQMKQIFEQRAEVGKKKYGVYLETDNGRDSANDGGQEVADSAKYFTKALVEAVKAEDWNRAFVLFRCLRNAIKTLDMLIKLKLVSSDSDSSN